MFSTNLSPIKVEVKEERFEALRLYHGCEKCSFKTKLLSRLRSHARIHENRKQQMNCSSGDLENYKCHKCKTFETHFLSQLRCHIVQGHTSHHVESITYKCLKCDFKSFSQLLILRHSVFTHQRRRKREKGDILKCTDCDFKTMYVRNLKAHLINRHTDDSEIQWFKCDHCSYKSKFNRDLKRHKILIHDPNFRYSCKLCDYKTKMNFLLQRHVNSRHNTEIGDSLVSRSGVYKCKHCDHKTMYFSNLRAHMIYRHLDDSEIKWFKCEKCQFKAKHKGNLKQHIFLKHDSNFRYSCKLCDYKAKLSSHLKRHMNGRHKAKNCDSLAGEHDICTEYLRNELGEKGAHKCTNCDYETKSLSSFRKHVVSGHLDDSEIQWFKCENCQFMTKHRSNLKRHIIAKHSNTLFRCKFCDYESKTRYALKQHVDKQHTAPGAHCSYKTKNKKSLVQHLKLEYDNGKL
ncbi:zinc finger X-chromosomal protein-like [Tribolium madens]|uniref:zinc finger X-chromosomal protein-like n=1 Tax=Tribolium madens TaxID=41895 RepID=UPI001CF736E3|nr:zinc finger X-chromosomal protein-like [Tribolium madens]